MIFPASMTGPAEESGQPFLQQDGLAEILGAGRQLNGTKALLEAMQDTLAVLTDMVREIGQILGSLAQPELAEAERRPILARHDLQRRQALGLLTALWHQDRSLAHVAGQEAPGILHPLAMLHGAPAQLMMLDPAQPAAAAAALQPGSAFAQLLQSLAEARDSVDSDCRYIAAQILQNEERLGLWEEETGLGAFADADLSKEATRLRALEVRQQLAGQSLGMQQYAPRCLMDLFARAEE